MTTNKKRSAGGGIHGPPMTFLLQLLKSKLDARCINKDITYWNWGDLPNVPIAGEASFRMLASVWASTTSEMFRNQFCKYIFIGIGILASRRNFPNVIHKNFKGFDLDVVIDNDFINENNWCILEKLMYVLHTDVYRD